jgi:hypothetical protein
MPIYCDESGYTGYNLLEKNQPYFVYSALNIEEEAAKDFVAHLKKKYHIQGELKGANLAKHINGKNAIKELYDEYAKDVKMVYHHKKYALACKYFEYVFEPAIYQNSNAFYQQKFHRFISNLVYVIFETTDDSAEDIFLKFQELIRGNDPEGLFHFLENENDPNKLTSLIAEFTILNRRHLLEEIMTDGKYDFWILDLAQTALHSLLAVWSMKIGPLTVVVDESKPLKEMAARNPLFQQLNDELVYYDPFGDGETAMNFTLKEYVSFSNSKKSFGLQLSDMFASSLYYTLIHPEDDLSKFIAENSAKFIPSPNNVCIAPEVGVYIRPGTLEFDKGIYFLTKLVELSRESTDDLGIRFSKLMLQKVRKYQRDQGLRGSNYTPPKKKRK